ncbi:MAG TPA: hypothetical protein PLD18_11995 [Flavobacterium sp.]|nr:hypothetical protein [Flavobacterium sp.]HRA72236.1 hypothetical protein [Flavobacterium sp.]
MENVLSQFKSDFFEVTLNSDQLFVHTSTSEEVFALRSINGISIVDLVDEYNTELTDWKKKANTPYYMYLFGGFFLLIDIVAVASGGFGNGKIIPSIVIGIALIYFGYKKQNKSKTEKPNLMSSLRIMLNGGVKDFKFDKADNSSANIADFVSQVVKTLTAYHKNNG